MSAPRPRRANRLARETSPYLLQHAENPVDWYPWGPEALETARRLDRPILLSIGYAACHWCHVMERESFENDAIAALMNEHFVCVKVDREERPDLDDIYMAATVAMTGSGGWPMTVFLSPDQRPFFAGTYFPPDDRYGRPGFQRLLTKIAEAWKGEREQLLEQADTLTHHIRQQSRATEPLSVGRDAMGAACDVLWQNFDREHGGFGSAPKFPPAATLSFLLAHYRQSADLRALEMVVGTLNGMKNGGMYDHIGGGFARYSTDARWLVPHFEKMLYDNAQLAPVYLEAYLVTGRTEYARVASETLDYVVREMQGPEGGYFSATDADSEGEEGKFFVWSPDQIAEVLDPPDAERFCAFYDVTPEGNWEGKSILNTPRSLAAVAEELGIAAAELAESLEHSKPIVYQARLQRVPPLLDDKILTAHNGLMIGAMAFGYQVLRDPAYLKSATRAADYLWTSLRREDSGLYRTARAGTAHLNAYLEDYAYLCDGLITLYEAGGDPVAIERAQTLGERILEDFGGDDEGAFYYTAHDHEALIARTREGHDGALPNPNSIAARALLRLGRHLGRDLFVERATAALMAYGRPMARLPRAFTSALSVISMALEPPLELVTAGDPDDPRTEELNATLGNFYAPSKVQAHVDESRPEHAARSPLTQGKHAVNGAPAVYVCENFTCQAPVTTPEALRSELDASEERRRAQRKAELNRRQLEGRAEAATTAAMAASDRGLGRHNYVELGDTGIRVSRLGFGAYRLGARDAGHAEALGYALECGVNLIDTSGAYEEGDSERVIGQTLARLVQQGTLTRQQVVVVSKLGHAQGATLAECRFREQQGRPYPEMEKVSPELWYCLHPSFLQHELDRSRARLGLATLDVCLLHNPEYFFEVKDPSADTSAPLAERRREFYRRIDQAFVFLESAVRVGSIGCYGVSSNTLARQSDDPMATDLDELIASAERAGGTDHHFRVIELPLNLLEPAAAQSSPDGGASLIERAAEKGLAVFTNRPLQAFAERGALRLVDPEPTPDAPAFEVAARAVAPLERRFAETLAPMIRVPEGAVPAAQLFAWSERLSKVFVDLVSVAQFDELEQGLIAPHVEDALSNLNRAFGPTHPVWAAWRDEYVPALRQLLAAARAVAAARTRDALETIRQTLADETTPGAASLSAAAFALACVRQCPGVSSVLIGMRQRRYVDDAVASLSLEPLRDPRAAFARLSRQTRHLVEKS